MLNHKPVNEWQKGLMSLFGYIDPLFWTVLWALALRADKDGFITLSAKDMGDAMVRDYQRIQEATNSTTRRMERVGLIRIARKRRVRWYKCEKTGQVKMVETDPKMFQIYGGIRRGKVPEGATRISGLCPSNHYRGRNVKWQTHKLVRKKFKV